MAKLKSKLECKLEWARMMEDEAVLKAARWLRALDDAAMYRDLSIKEMAQQIIDGTVGVPKSSPRLFEHLWAEFACDNDRNGFTRPDEVHNRVELLEFAADAVKEATKEKDARGNK